MTDRIPPAGIPICDDDETIARALEDVSVSTPPASTPTGSSGRWTSSGARGVKLREHWGDDPPAYLGITVRNSPNPLLQLRPGHESRARRLPDLPLRVPGGLDHGQGDGALAVASGRRLELDPRADSRGLRSRLNPAARRSDASGRRGTVWNGPYVAASARESASGPECRSGCSVTVMPVTEF